MDKLCLFCKSFYFCPGEYGTSSGWTPGWDARIGCYKNHITIDLFEDTTESYREKILTAGTCPDFETVLVDGRLPKRKNERRMHSLYWDDSCEIEITILKATRSALDEYDLGSGSNFITLEQEHVDALKAGKALAWRCADVSTFVVFEDAPLTES